MGANLFEASNVTRIKPKRVKKEKSQAPVL